MLPIQCSCCKCGGHQIGKQVCRIGAQQFHIKSCAEKHLKEFEENAKWYETMNRPKVIKKVCADTLLLTDINHFLDESEDRLNLFYVDYPSDDCQVCRNESMVLPARPKTPQISESITTTTTTPSP